MPDLPIRFRTPTPTDAEKLSTLLEQHSITMVGLGERRFLRAVVADATTGGRANIVLAHAAGGIIGWSIAVINPRAYWRGFILRHPVFGARILHERMRTARVREREGPGTGSGLTLEDDQSVGIQWPLRSSVIWGSSRDSVAKHIDITIIEPFRNAGIGCQLQRAHFESLQRYGVRRVDAVISKGNVPSIKFHIKLGWSLVRTDETMLYITKEIE